MRTRIVAGNWKMHGNVAANTAFMHTLNELKQDDAKETNKLVVCPSFVHLQQISELLPTSCALGSQDVSSEPKGAFTGQVSSEMLKEFGVTYSIVGHSERRALCGETNESVAAKAAFALQNHLIPIVCVGESEDQYTKGETKAHIKSQLSPILALPVTDIKNLVIAYEPIWAIGTGKTATPDIAQSVHEYIRQCLVEVDASLDSVSILYGGSVKAENAKDLIAMPDIDGFLVGGASLDAAQFYQIYQHTLS